MTSKIIWKLVLSACVLAWSVYYLLPLHDTPYGEFLVSNATAKVTDLQALISKAEKQVAQANKWQTEDEKGKAAGQAPLVDHDRAEFIRRHRTLFLALKSMGEDDKVDYFQFFPNLPIGDVKNINKRNETILKELLKWSKARVKYGLDLEGGVGFTLSVDDSQPGKAGNTPKTEVMQKVVEIMDHRINGLGVSEPIIRPRGDNSLEIQMPGVSTKDNPEAIDILKKPAKLEFRLVHRTLDPANTPADQKPFDYVVLNEERENKDTGQTYEVPTFVNIRPAAPGSIVKVARVQSDMSGQVHVTLTMTDEGAKIFENITGQMIEDNKPYASLPENHPLRYGRLAIVLDGKLYSAPRVLGVLSTTCEITGDFSVREALNLANVLNNPLDQPLKLDAMYEVGPTLAKEARASSINAGLLGTALVVLFMMVMYRLAGFLSVVTLALNVIVILGIQTSFGATLTLPGVAALVLTIGMAVDANILIYERMREEMLSGKGLLNSLEAGHDRAFAAILDSHVTSIITAAILIWLGTGPVKGFGVILAVGLASNLFCVLVFNHALLELFITRGWMSKLRFLKLIPDTKLPFYSYRKVAIGLSVLVLAIGVGAIFMKGPNALGTDFRGGEEVSIHFAKEIPQAEIEQVAKSAGVQEVTAAYQTELGTGIRTLKIQTEADMGQKLFDALVKARPDAELKSEGVMVIKGTVSESLKWNALMAVALSLVGVMIYVAFRFEVGYAIGAIVATLHDVIITVGVYILLGGQFTSPMVAAVLMIIGYSLNDTVIVFDRVREELKLNPHLKLVQVLDLAVNRTLARTTLTSLTTFLAAVSLFVFGAGVVHEFALIFMIGIATGTMSSIFIANPVFCWWHKGDRHHVEAREVLPKYEWDSSSKLSRQ